jgi:hypothetical protein
VWAVEMMLLAPEVNLGSVEHENDIVSSNPWQNLALTNLPPVTIDNKFVMQSHFFPSANAYTWPTDYYLCQIYFIVTYL